MSGSTAMRAARQRPSVPIMVLTNELRTARRLAVLWGAHCVQTDDVSNTQEMVEKACRLAVREGYANLGDTLVITAGVPFKTPGTTNRSEEHTSELQSLMRNSYAVFCLKQKQTSIY